MMERSHDRAQDAPKYRELASQEQRIGRVEERLGSGMREFRQEVKNDLRDVQGRLSQVERHTWMFKGGILAISAIITMALSTLTLIVVAIRLLAD